MEARSNRSRIMFCILCFASLLLVLAGCAGGSGAGSDSSDAADAPSQPQGGTALQVADAIDVESIPIASGSICASDGKYLYFSYRSLDEGGGLYRVDLGLEHAEMLDRGRFINLHLLDGMLYYVDNAGSSKDDITYWRLDTQSLHSEEIAEEDYREVAAATDQSGGSALSRDERYRAVVDGTSYFIEYLGEAAENNESDSVPLDDYALYCSDAGGGAPTGVEWKQRGALEGVLCAYGDYVFYSRPWHPGSNNGNAEAKDGVEPDYTKTRDERPESVPCCYNTKTGVETLLVRDRGINGDVFAINATSGFLITSSYEDFDPDGSSMIIESLTDPSLMRHAYKLVDEATEAQEFTQQEADEAAAEEEALRNEPYGPGTSTLHLSAPEDKSACYRLVRMDGSTEFMILLGPGEEIAQSFPSGRYTLKIAEGTEWISDEEAFGSAGHYSTTDVFTFERGSSYEIGSGTKGDFKGDDASGFTG